MSSLYSLLLAPIHPDWKPCIKENTAQFEAITDRVIEMAEKGEKLTPQVGRVFEAFRLSPKRIRVVIVGQDPYPTPGMADGLCFSTRQDTLPKSLANVLPAIRRGHPHAQLSRADLRPWLFEGVLLLNTALTTIEGSTKEHVDLWAPFSSHIIGYVSKAAPSPVFFLLWGMHAKSLRRYIDSRHMVLEYAHPSPMGAASTFHNCDHFDVVSRSIPICWDTVIPWHIYTDGSGHLREYGTWAVVVSHPGIGSFYGRVQPFKHVIDEDGRIAVDESFPIPATAQRGEYLAISYALFICARLLLSPRIILFSDSLNAIKTIGGWYHEREKKGKLSGFENLDIIEVMMAMYARAYYEATSSIEFEHVAGHQPLPPLIEGGTETEEAMKIRGNHEADRLAGEARKLKEGQIARTEISGAWIDM